MTEDSTTSGWATTPARYVAISVFWFAISLFWAMALTQIIQYRVLAFVGEAHKGAGVAVISIGGALAAGAIQLFIGPISDRCRARWGRRRPFIFWGAVGGSASIVLFAFAHSFALLVAAFMGIQMLLNVANGPYQAMIPDHAPRSHQGRASAVMGLMQLLGEGGGPLLAGVVIYSSTSAPHGLVANIFGAHTRDLALRNLMLIDAAAIMLCALFTVFAVPDEPASLEASTTPLNPFGNLEIRKNADFYRLLLSRTLYNLGFYVALQFLLYYGRDTLHLGDRASLVIGLVQLTAVGFGVLSTFPAGWLADTGRKKIAVYFSCVFSGIAAVIFAFATSLHAIYVLGALFGIGYGLFRSVDWAFACNLLPKSGGAARWLAIWSLSQIIPQVLAPGWGPIGDALNHISYGLGWRGAMVASAVFVVIGGAVVSTIPEPAISDDADGATPNPKCGGDSSGRARN